jgi:hypothetical protein
MWKRLLILVAVVVATTMVLGVSPARAEGKALGKDRVLSKVTFIHYRRGFGKPPGTPGGGKKKDSGYYDYIANGAKWRTIEDYRLNLACEENVAGSLDQVIEDAVLAGLSEWESAGGESLEIFGDVVLDGTVTYEDGAYRGYNTVSFGPYGDPNVIAVVTVWGYFGGKPSGREIVEAHLLFNDGFVWGDAALSPEVMDIQNIATHELGHCAGMGDVYEGLAAEETMYGYSENGELKKRDLYTGDIAGITKLY